MATPHVTGAVALMRSVDPAISADEVFADLTQTARPLVAGGRNPIPAMACCRSGPRSSWPPAGPGPARPDPDPGADSDAGRDADPDAGRHADPRPGSDPDAHADRDAHPDRPRRCSRPAHATAPGTLPDPPSRG